MLTQQQMIYGTIRDPFTGTLLEGLIQTIEIDKAINILDRSLKGKLPIKRVGSSIHIGLSKRITDDDYHPYYSNLFISDKISYILELTNNLGYFPSNFILVKDDGFKIKKPWNNTIFKDEYDVDQNYIIVFEPKYDIKIDQPKILYHITKDENIKGIKKIGLKPSNQNKRSNHSERVYFSLTKEDSYLLWKGMRLDYKFKPSSILTIDTTGLILNLYNDPNFDKKGVYTYQNIPPQNIINYEPINIDNE